VIHVLSPVAAAVTTQVLSAGADHVLSAGATQVLSAGADHVLSAGVLQVLSPAVTTVPAPGLQVLSPAVSPVVPARPLRAPKAKAAEKAAASAERSILLCIVGFVLI